MVMVLEISMMAKPAYAEGRPCSVASRPVSSSSSLTRKPTVFRITVKAITIVTTVQSAVTNMPPSCFPSCAKPPP